MFKSTAISMSMLFASVVLLLSLDCIQCKAQQGCPAMYLETQSQVDSFPINYPGCTRILGELSINSEYIYSLDSLYSIQIIEGDLDVLGFNNFHGLHNVDSIYGNLYLRPGWGLVTSFDSLKYIGGDLEMVWTDADTMPGFPVLTTVGDDLEIIANQFLEDLTGLSNVNSVKGGLFITNNYSLTTLESLQNLQSDSIEVVNIYYNPL